MPFAWVALEFVEFSTGLTIWTIRSMYRVARWAIYGDQPTRQELETEKLRAALVDLTEQVHQLGQKMGPRPHSPAPIDISTELDDPQGQPNDATIHQQE